MKIQHLWGSGAAQNDRLPHFWLSQFVHCQVHGNVLLSSYQYFYGVMYGNQMRNTRKSAGGNANAVSHRCAQRKAPWA